MTPATPAKVRTALDTTTLERFWDTDLHRVAELFRTVHRHPFSRRQRFYRNLQQIITDDVRWANVGTSAIPDSVSYRIPWPDCLPMITADRVERAMRWSDLIVPSWEAM